MRLAWIFLGSRCASIPSYYSFLDANAFHLNAPRTSQNSLSFFQKHLPFSLSSQQQRHRESLSLRQSEKRGVPFCRRSLKPNTFLRSEKFCRANKITASRKKNALLFFSRAASFPPHNVLCLRSYYILLKPWYTLASFLFRSHFICWPVLIFYFSFTCRPSLDSDMVVLTALYNLSILVLPSFRSIRYRPLHRFICVCCVLVEHNTLLCQLFVEIDVTMPGMHWISPWNMCASIPNICKLVKFC